MRRRYFVLAAIVLLGCALRLYALDRVPLRGDEVFTVTHWMREPLADTLANIATVDPQPPLIYALYRAYALIVGSQEQVVRFLPAFGNLLGITAMYCLGCRLLGSRVGLLAAFLWAIHPFEIWHAQDARSYALWASASVVALAAALQALRRDRPRWWLLYTACALIAAYLYYLELFVVVSLNLFVFVAHRRQPRLLRHWLFSQVAFAAGLAVWFLQPRLLVSSGYGGTAGPVEPLRLLTWFVPTLTFGDTLPAALLAVLGCALVALFVLCLAALARQHRPRAALLLALVGILPLILLALVSTRLAVFTPRYVLASAPAYMLLLATAVILLGRDRRRRWLAASLCVVIVSVNLLTLNNFFLLNDYAKSKDWRALTRFIGTHSTAQDIVINASADIAYSFYHDEVGAASTYLYLPASDRQSEQEILDVLTTRTRPAEAVWIVADTPAAWHTRGLVERWVDSRMQRVWDTSAAGLRAQQYRHWQVRGDELSQLQSTPAFTEWASLLGYQTFVDEEQNALLVWLYWQPRAVTPASLKVFVHLIGEPNPQTGSPLWSQDDQLPQDGRVNTTNWPLGAVLRDVYVLPLTDVEDGTYSLEVGMYDPVTQARILLANGQDALSIAEIAVE